MDEFQIKMFDNQKNMGIDIAEIKVSLAYHIKRTDLLEESVELSRAHLDKDLKPIKAHVVLVNNTLKIFGGITIIVGFIAAIMEIYSYIK